MIKTKAEQTTCFLLRQAFSRSCLYWETLRRVKKASNQYQCEKCKGIFKLREMAVDHKVPVTDIEKGWEGIAVFASRLFCDYSNLWALCQDNCHAKKTKLENKKRK